MKICMHSRVFRAESRIVVYKQSRVQMASVSFNPEFASLSAETPVFFFTNQCDTCGKTFAHSSSYRRHARTQCDSQTRKHHRNLWLPDESDRSDKEDEDDGVAPLLNTLECETEGNIIFVCIFSLYYQAQFQHKIYMNKSQRTQCCNF